MILLASSIDWTEALKLILNNGSLNLKKLLFSPPYLILSYIHLNIYLTFPLLAQIYRYIFYIQVWAIILVISFITYFYHQVTLTLTGCYSLFSKIDNLRRGSPSKHVYVYILNPQSCDTLNTSIYLILYLFRSRKMLAEKYLTTHIHLL